MKSYKIYQVDAFTNQLFGGNPAAVVPLESWLPDETMQKIASENNVSETAFFVKNKDGYMLRWFTPGYEIDLCGHATLATAHIIFQELGYKNPQISFETRFAGKLTVTHLNGLYTLNFPSRIAEKIEAPEILLKALGGPTPKATFKSRDYLFVYDTEEIVANLTPDFSLMESLDIKGVIVTAKGNHCDFVSRFFIPSAGINEDPVTGSAHCNLIPYWAKELNKNHMHAFQISSRTGELWCELVGDRVLMSGNAITFLKGEIYL